MKRRLLNLLTWLSLLLFIGVTALAVRSYWNSDAITVRWNPGPAEPHSSGHIVCFTSWPGQVWLNFHTVTDADPAFWRGLFHRSVIGTYTVGGDGPAVQTVSRRWSRLSRGRRWSGRKPSFHRSRSEDVPAAIDGGAAAGVVYRTVVVPYWSVMLLTATLPLARLGGVMATCRRRTVRASRGQCIRCGYDLRATPEQCPECGKTSRPFKEMHSAPTDARVVPSFPLSKA